ncbi:MAG TPA: hypothetical protein VMR31_12060 [Myxococcota bacterium]|nr:hypothetical protein [Myxococcota bacterium]
MGLIRRVVVLLVLLAPALTARGASIRIGFENGGLLPPNTGIIIPKYREAGFEFYDALPPFMGVPAGLGRVGPGGAVAANGTSTMDVLYAESLAFDREDGGTFDLVSIDLAEYSTVYPTPMTIELVGDRVDGTSVAATFTTDGIVYGGSSTVDFQTFALPDSFRDLIRVHSPTQGYAFDNVVVSVAPEPGAALLAALVALVIRAARA